MNYRGARTTKFISVYKKQSGLKVDSLYPLLWLYSVLVLFSLGKGGQYNSMNLCNVVLF